tara:strand:- start:1910 stop:2617 length:708 start_codon:yes stop_codon:yes gene_type:complete
MRVTIMQPAYLSWIGYFDRISQSDLFIYLDNVQLDKSSKTRFTNRNKINTNNGPLWLTVPIVTKGKSHLHINKLKLVEDQWKKKHKKNIQFNYANAPFFGELSKPLIETYEQDWELLVDLIYYLDTYLFDLLKINTPVIRSSEIGVEGQKSEYILNLCKAKGATEYVSGIFGLDYLDKSAFKNAGIKILIHDYEPIPYNQNFKNFTPYLSVIDLIFNNGLRSTEWLNRASNLSVL